MIRHTLAVAALVAVLPMSSAHALTVTAVANDSALTAALGGSGEPLMKFVGEGRIGDNTIGGATFEYDTGLTTAGPFPANGSTGQYSWINGDNSVFSFDYNKTSGVSTLSLGTKQNLATGQLKLVEDTDPVDGFSQLHTVSFNVGASLGITDLYLRARANPGTSVLFEDLQVQIGGAIGPITDVVPVFAGNYPTSADPLNPLPWISPAIIRMSGESFTDGFTLGGSVTFNWGSVQPKNSALAFQIKAAVPEPETYAMLLAGLGLLGFAARRRKLA